MLLVIFLVSGCWEKDDPRPKVLQYIELPKEGGGTTRVEGQNIRLNLTNVSTYQQSNEPFAYDLNGTLPVNHYFGRYSVTGSPIVPSEDPQTVVLDVRQVGSTKIGVSGKLLQLELLYLQALEEVNLATLSKEGGLVLHSRYQNAKLVYLSAELCSLPE
ncbi:hypothetical protein DC20_03520 [Rufibacter tibetensis]|uniref:Uncharacterized protein n=1 Tax=Rufibacter tibetensis TaxID=512763 RepID=A0A0P0C9T2_9BACT|nr:hypothetical protein DC20_03520 [Rufibacter tibetensis]